MTPQDILPKLDYSKYSGKWAVVCDNKIVAHNKDLIKIKRYINRCKKVPTVAKIPAEGQHQGTESFLI